MKKLDLMPTAENLVQLYEEDSIGRDNDLNEFVNLLCHIEDSCSIAVDGKWGTGKTFYIKQTKMILDAHNPSVPFYNTEIAQKIRTSYANRSGNNGTKELPPIVTAYYDAWSHDNQEDPILSLMYEIVKDNHGNSNIENKRELSDIITAVLDFVSNRDVTNVIEKFRGKDLFEEQKNSDDIETLISKALADLLPERGNQLVVFIDELDRCSPIFAVKLLERVKHYFLCENVTFVFSVNTYELQHTIRRFYGDAFDACRYLDRFFDMRLEIPPVDMPKLLWRYGLGSQNNMRQTTCLEVISQMNMSMREISRFLQMTKIAAYKYTDGDSYERQRFWSNDDGTSKLIGFSVIVPIVIGLKMTDREAYEAFVNGNDGTWLEKIIMSDRLNYWIPSALLEWDEAYSAVDGKKTVEMKNKIRSVYEAIFVKKYENSKEYCTKIGKGVFEKELRRQILQAAGLVSTYSDYTV